MYICVHRCIYVYIDVYMYIYIYKIHFYANMSSNKGSSQHCAICLNALILSFLPVIPSNALVLPSWSFEINSCCRDLDQSCMDAVAALLRGLPLQPEESDRGDLMEAKSQLFLKYFTLFMNLLNDCTEAQEVGALEC